jgi:hypothetical protein
MRIATLALVAAAALLCGGPAVAGPGDEIGATVRIVNLVTAEYARDERDLRTGDPVRQDELIVVSDDGIGEIRLRDDTELALGPGARLKLDEFVYNPDISGGAIVVDLVEGAFRFITGLAARPAYVINTPTASITVRGTIFDIYVEEDGTSWLLLIEGAIEACNDQRQCRDLDEPGKLIRITPDGVVGDPLKWADQPTGGLAFDVAFPFVVTPPEIDPDPIFTAEEIVDGKIPDGPLYDDDDYYDDHASDVIVDDDGPGAYPLPPLYCWHGWKKVHRGWHEKGWRVHRRRSGNRVIYCAIPIFEPPPIIDLPSKPQCIGGNIVMLKTFPPRWRCICPGGKKRIWIGPNAWLCKGKPGGGDDPKDDCLKKGWKWVGGVCVPGKACPPGTVGKWPNCKKVVEPPKVCPEGTVGKWPNCKEIVVPPKVCPEGTVGKWPNCKKVVEPPKVCPEGTVGKWPNCKKVIEPPKVCPEGTVGKWPNCKEIVVPPKVCPEGTVGKWPNCKKIVLPPKVCPEGTVGKWPNCKKIVVPPKLQPKPKACPAGTTGKWPNCKKIVAPPKLQPKPKACPEGTVGKWPNCKKVEKPKTQGESPKKLQLKAPQNN